MSRRWLGALLVFLVFSEFSVGAVSEVPGYHERVGVPLVARIWQKEHATDFDGGRVAGGSPTPLGLHPYAGGIIISFRDGSISLCSSVLVSHTRSLTAAHCWRTLGALVADQLTVVLGSQRLFSGGVRLVTRSVANHEFYIHLTSTNDISVISHAWVGYNAVIQPVNLPSGAQVNNQFVGVSATVSGYGTTYEGEELTYEQTLRHVELQVISNAECSLQLSAVSASTLCTATAGGSTCHGDSGGPLVASLGGQPVLIGIVAMRVPGCTDGRPDLYTRITSYVPWIQERL